MTLPEKYGPQATAMNGLLHETVEASTASVSWSTVAWQLPPRERPLDPATPPTKTRQFLLVGGLIRGVHLYGLAVLRAACRHRGNDHRLGAKRGAPAINCRSISAPTRRVTSRFSTAKSPARFCRLMQTGVRHLPAGIPQDPGDRNRTFALSSTGTASNSAPSLQPSVAGPLVAKKDTIWLFARVYA